MSVIAKEANRMPFEFSTKAQTLSRLSRSATKSNFCEQIIVERAKWATERTRISNAIADQFAKGKAIIRSSAKSEDTNESSLAGAHLSLLNVLPEVNAISTAVDEVFKSYLTPMDTDEVLVQPMLEHAAISGVVLTRDLDTGSPYFVINYDDFSGRTDSVTSGDDSKTIFVHRSKPEKLRSPRLRKLIDSVIEIEQITGHHELDIEFFVSLDDDVYILQVRPLSAKHRWLVIPDYKIDNAIDAVREALESALAPSPSICGQSSVLTEMTDWNPAEMIGNTPRPLALALYKTLITDRIWSDARRDIGYRAVEGPLLLDLFGRPYIDVRKSFNSFLPTDVPAVIGEKLVNHQLSMLAENRELHDKVEFDICVTSWDFNVNENFKRFADAGLTKDEANTLAEKIAALTKSAIEPGAIGIKNLLAQNQHLAVHGKPAGQSKPTISLDEQFDNCRTFGTLPFAKLARHGFIAVQLLRSLVARGACGEADVAAFMREIHTVATEFSTDFYSLAVGTLDQQAFLKKYGHLRPGTYDITSWRYDEKPDLYLAHMTSPTSPIPSSGYKFSNEISNNVQSLLSEMGYDLTVVDFTNYLSAAIQGREQAKFAFTKNVSNILSALSAWGAAHDLARDDISFLSLETLRSDRFDKGAVAQEVAAARERYEVTRAIRLPHVISSTDDVDVVRVPLGQPTFISNKSVTARARHLTAVEGADIDNRIVLIESADPGFDWIFSHSISGLITKYGGANSHMAIRCAEFGLPAAIGCGERIFDSLLKASVIELNAVTKKVSAHS